jgi:hypothetical protein
VLLGVGLLVVALVLTLCGNVVALAERPPVTGHPSPEGVRWVSAEECRALPTLSRRCTENAVGDRDPALHFRSSPPPGSTLDPKVARSIPCTAHGENPPPTGFSPLGGLVAQRGARRMPAGRGAARHPGP